MDVVDRPQFRFVKGVLVPPLWWSGGWGALVCWSWSGVVPVGEVCPGVVPKCPPGTFPAAGSRRWGVEQDAAAGGEPPEFLGPEASVISSSAPGPPASCPRCRGASFAPRRFGCVAARAGSPVAYGPSWSGGQCPCPGPVSLRPACREGALRCSSNPLFGPSVSRGSPWPCVRGVLPPWQRAGRRPWEGGGKRAGRTICCLVEVCGERCLSRSLGRRGNGGDVRLLGAGPLGPTLGIGLQMMSVGRWGRWGLHGFRPYPHGRRLAVLREAAGGCGAGSGQGSLFPGATLACRPAPLGGEGCLSPSAGRMVDWGFCTCQRGNPARVVAPGSVLGSYGMTPACRAPGPLGTVDAGGRRRVPGSPGTQMFCLSMAVRMRRAARWCQSQCSPFIPSGL